MSLPAPWNRGRVVLIGDAAHACPPTIAQGAAQALEDAVVLAELLARRATRSTTTLWAGVHRTAGSTRAEDGGGRIGAARASGCSSHEQGDVPGLMAVIASPRHASPADTLPKEETP